MSDTGERWRPFRLIPDDVLFFRDGRPSTRGDDHYLRSLFPPHPSTLYGAIRTRRLIDEGVDLTKLGPNKKAAWKKLPPDLRAEIGEWGAFGSLEVRGPWMVRGEEVLLPAPGDLAVTVEPGRSKKGIKRWEEPQLPRVSRVARFLLGEPPGPRGGHSHPLALLTPYVRQGKGWTAWTPRSIPPRPAHGWYLTEGGFGRWATGLAPEPEELVHSSELWVDEPRIGVGIEEDARLSRDGHLYTFGFIRLREGVTLGFEARHTALQPKGRVRLGGEGRTCWVTTGPALPETPAKSSGPLRLALATPALTDSGSWLPGFAHEPSDGGDIRGEIQGQTVRLVSACLPGYSLAGGWDLARGGPKPLRRTIPPGTVYAIEPADAGNDIPATKLHGTTHSDFPGEHLARQGFGLLLAGAEPSRPS